MTDGAQQFGIYGEEMGLSESEVFSALENGHPIICSMRPGDFTNDRTLYRADRDRRRKDPGKRSEQPGYAAGSCGITADWSIKSTIYGYIRRCRD